MIQAKFIKKISVIDTLRCMPIGSEIFFTPRQAEAEVIRHTAHRLKRDEKKQYEVSKHALDGTRVVRLS